MRSNAPVPFVKGMGFSVDGDLAAIRARNRSRGLGLGSGLGAPSLASLLGSAGGLVRSVRFRSNLTPPVTWDPNAPSAPATADDGSSTATLATLQPALDVELAAAPGQWVTIAPAGEPTGDYRVLVGGVVVAVVGSFALAVAIGWALGRRSRGGRR